jgi:hypothetical protein
MPPTEPNLPEIVENILAEDAGPIIQAGVNGEVPQEVLDAVQDFTSAWTDTIAVGRAFQAELDEIAARRDLIPAAGVARLRNEARESALSKTRELDHEGRRAYERLRVELENAALPRFNPAREQLARDEAMLALSAGSPADLALNGTDEAIAALLSPWGKTALRARGVRDVDRVLADVRRTAVARAVDRGETPAARLLKTNHRKLSAVMGSAAHQTKQLARR